MMLPIAHEILWMLRRSKHNKVDKKEKNRESVFNLSMEILHTRLCVQLFHHPVWNDIFQCFRSWCVPLRFFTTAEGAMQHQSRSTTRRRFSSNFSHVCFECFSSQHISLHHLGARESVNKKKTESKLHKLVSNSLSHGTTSSNAALSFWLKSGLTFLLSQYFSCHSVA